MTKRQSNKGKGVFSLSMLLTYLFIAALVTTGVTLSRFSTVSSGGDQARVARFEVDVAPPEDETNMNFNGSTVEADTQTIIYPFTVTSNSEVAVDYTIQVDFMDKLPENVSVAVDDQNPQSGAANFSFTGGSLAPGAEPSTHELKITVTHASGEALIGTVPTKFESNFHITVKAIQHNPSVTN